MNTLVTALKSVALRAFTATGAAELLRGLNRDSAVVFMLHRFTDPDRGVVGDDPAQVRQLLSYLRRKRYALVSLESLLQSLAGETAPLRNGVAFTIDDGYREQATIAGPLFAEFDCPVTTFVTTGFLDQELWFWWDRIAYIFRHCRAPSITLHVDSRELRYTLGYAAVRDTAQAEFTALCKALPDADKERLIQRLAAEAEVALPERAPDEYAPMTWDELRACERRGMTFGPHTVTHPILARVGDVRAETEIVASWARLRSQATRAVPIFAYPNGQRGDFGEREFAVLRRAGLAAVTGVSGFATRPRYQGPDGTLLVPRFSFPDSLPQLVQVVSGLERLKFALRGES